MTKKEYDAKRYIEQKAKILAQSKIYYENNKEAVNKRHARWRSENKEAASTYEKAWRLANKARARAKVRNYQARKRQAMPSWVDLEEIVKIYEGCPKGYEVDHEIPLQGKNICGLHVPANLQYLPISKNRSKSNKF
jgi:hypothetical protein